MKSVEGVIFHYVLYFVPLYLLRFIKISLKLIKLMSSASVRVMFKLKNVTYSKWIYNNCYILQMFWLFFFSRVIIVTSICLVQFFCFILLNWAISLCFSHRLKNIFLLLLHHCFSRRKIANCISRKILRWWWNFFSWLLFDSTSLQCSQVKPYNIYFLHIGKRLTTYYFILFCCYI